MGLSQSRQVKIYLLLLEVEGLQAGNASLCKTQAGFHLINEHHALGSAEEGAVGRQDADCKFTPR